MSVDQIKAEAISLPLADRLALAQTLWESLEVGVNNSNETTAVAESIKRDGDLTSGAVTGRSHERVMQAARLAIG